MQRDVLTVGEVMEIIEPDHGQGEEVLPRTSSLRQRSKTSQRLKYEAETAVLRKEMGSLEDIRIRLGFSRRKICQILMVDPSAWTRWTSGGSDAPPHVYQALRWYLDSKTNQATKIETYWEELKTANRELHEKMVRLQSQHKKLRLLTGGLLLAALGLMAYLIWLATHTPPEW